jgi:hypothetical protein
MVHNTSIWDSVRALFKWHHEHLGLCEGANSNGIISRYHTEMHDRQTLPCGKEYFALPAEDTAELGRLP